LFFLQQFVENGMYMGYVWSSRQIWWFQANSIISKRYWPPELGLRMDVGVGSDTSIWANSFHCACDNGTSDEKKISDGCSKKDERPEGNKDLSAICGEVGELFPFCR
jgi:hypothetical protein